MEQYDEKLDCLVKMFEPQLAKLKGVSRPVQDWVQDQILNPAGANGMELSIHQAITLFENGYEILGSSPQMFTDYSWYKDIWYDYKGNYKQQFIQKRLSLLMANMPEKNLTATEAEMLVQHFEEIGSLSAEYEKNRNGSQISEILKHMKEMDASIEKFDQNFFTVFLEIEATLACIQETGTVEMEKYENLFSAFGRTQQYIAFMKK